MIGNLEDPRKTFGKAVSDIAREDPRVVVLSADSGKSSGFGDFLKEVPERYFEFGIMEQGVTGIAAGLATAGKIPVFCAIAPFVTARNFEMFRNDLGYMRQNAKMVGRNGGITYSDLGATHHSLDDFALIRMIPGVVILFPQDPNEIRTACRAMIDHTGPVYMRVGNAKIPNLFEEEPFVIGRSRKIRDGGDLTIVSTGPSTGAAIEAADRLSAMGIRVDLIGLPTVWPLDEEAILASAAKTRKVLTVEEHYVYGGIGTMISDLLSAKCPTPVRKVGVPHDSATPGPYDEILHHYGLDADGICAAAEEFVRQG